MIDLFITPSIIQQFVLKPEWGKDAYEKTLYPDKRKQEHNYFTKTGNRIHEKLGFNNNKRFYTTFPLKISGRWYNVAMEGTPDHLNPLKELKTVSYYKFVRDKYKEKVVEAASYQLLGYMMLTDEEYGYVVLYCREGVIDEYSVVVHRDDEKFKEKVKEFFEYIL